MTKQQRQLQTLYAIDAINDMARQARALCTDIIRQTTTKPYYGKRGAAALYAASDESETQAVAIATAVDLLHAANELLVDIAINGGTTEAKLRAIICDSIGALNTYGDS